MGCRLLREAQSEAFAQAAGARPQQRGPTDAGLFHQVPGGLGGHGMRRVASQQPRLRRRPLTRALSGAWPPARCIQGAARLLAGGAVDNIVMEYSPHVAEKGLK